MQHFTAALLAAHLLDHSLSMCNSYFIAAHLLDHSLDLNSYFIAAHLLDHSLDLSMCIAAHLLDHSLDLSMCIAAHLLDHSLDLSMCNSYFTAAHLLDHSLDLSMCNSYFTAAHLLDHSLDLSVCSTSLLLTCWIVLWTCLRTAFHCCSLAGSFSGPVCVQHFTAAHLLDCSLDLSAYSISLLICSVDIVTSLVTVLSSADYHPFSEYVPCQCPFYSCMAIRDAKCLYYKVCKSCL